MAQSFRDLLVWQKAMDMTVAVYEVTRTFPSSERFGLSSQLNRASVSVASNIAEGRGRNSQAEFKHFLSLAQGSNYEVQTQLLLSKRLKIAKETQLDSAEGLSIEVGKMLSSLITTIRAKS